MSKGRGYTKGEKGSFCFIEGKNSIIFRISVIFRMSFAHRLKCEAPTPPPPLLFSCINKGNTAFC